MKKILALLLAAALLGAVPALASPSEPPAPDDIFILGEASESGDMTVLDTAGSQSVRLFRSFAAAPAAEGGSGLPAAYDPRRSGFLPPVRSQGTWNSCWAMGAVGAAEIGGLGSGLLSAAPEDVDLSERHLIYFFTHQADDPLGNSSLDYNTNASFWIRRGGNPILAAMTFAGWHGAADETATNSLYDLMEEEDYLDPAYAYTDLLHLEDTCVLNLSGSSGRTALKQLLLEHGAAVLCLYYDARYLFAGSPSERLSEDRPEAEDSAEDPETAGDDGDGTAPDDLPPREDAAPAEDEETLPDETPLPRDDETLPDEDAEPSRDDETLPDEDAEPSRDDETLPDEDAEPSPDDDAPTDEAEDAAEAEGGGEPPIALDGAAEDESAPEDTDAGDFTVCYYQDAVSASTNHEVVVIGWDDEYPAENFGLSSRGAVPPRDGAWLCRNSYGPGWSGGDGYFWISYYDACVSYNTDSIDGRATVFIFGSADNFENNYEYDGAVVLGYVNDAIDGRGVSTLTAAADSSRWYANVFAAAANDRYRGYELLRAVSTYTYRPGVSYTVEIYTGLADGGDPASGTLAASTAGTFAYPGLHTVRLEEPVKLSRGESFSVVFRISRASDGSIFVPACYTSASWYSTNDTAEGQSFVSMNGEAWHDCIGLNNTPNVRIKAYTDTVYEDFPFADVPSEAWYSEAVEAGWLNRLFEGVAPDTFDPEAPAARAQICAVLRRLAGSPETEAETSFADVSPAAWYYKDVCWAEAVGLVVGSDDDGDGVFTFRPDAPITREEFITVLYRFSSLLNVDVTGRAELSAFEDGAVVSDWAVEAVRWSIAEEVTLGIWTAPAGYSILPGDPVTRAQLAVFIFRLF